MNLIRAFIKNCGNQDFDANGELQEAETSSIRVQMQGTGAEQLEVAMKLL